VTSTDQPDDSRVTEEPLLQSIVDVARGIFGAAASSILVVDETREHLVFSAVSGAGAGKLLGSRFPLEAGIAGFALSAGEAMIVDDTTANPAFAQDIARATGYVPRSIMAAPLLSEGEPIGVLEVLDPVPDERRALGDLDLLTLFASQAALALAMARRARATQPPELHALIDALATSEGQRVLTGLQSLLAKKETTGPLRMTA
jgi:GAF domain-containing protein